MELTKGGYRWGEEKYNRDGRVRVREEVGGRYERGRWEVPVRELEARS